VKEKFAAATAAAASRQAAAAAAVIVKVAPDPWDNRHSHRVTTFFTLAMLEENKIHHKDMLEDDSACMLDTLPEVNYIGTSKTYSGEGHPPSPC
jgi:hypothetical protein